MRKALIVASVVSMIEQFNMGNIKLLQKKGYEVYVACNFLEGSTSPDARNIQFKRELESMNITCHQIDFSRKGIAISQHISAYKQLKFVLEEDYELVHFHSPIGGAIGRLASRKSREKGTRIIYTAHGFHFYKGASLVNWLIYYPVERWLSKYTDTLVTINQEDYNRAKKFKETNVVYVPGVGIDLENIKDINIDRNKKREELGVPRDSFVMTSVGELNKNKNHQVVIHALSELDNKNIHYLICGTGDLKDKLIELSRNLGIAEQVHLLGFRDDIHEINKVSDLFVFPSHREGLPVSLMEAMAVGLPVVASNIRGNEDLIEEKGGNLIPPQSVRLWTETIFKFYKLPVITRLEIGKYNKKNIEKYNLKNVLQYMMEIYYQDIN